MSWVVEDRSRSWVERLMNSVLKSGPIPHHVAFIMDGNRRFARKKSIEREEGHLQGFERLAKTLDWCLELGITEVTVYAFSIENFKRSKQEVDGLLKLATQKFARLIEEKDKLMEHGVRVTVWGRLDLLPEELQVLIAHAMETTRDNNKAQLNVCLAYTSRDEMCVAMKEVAEGVKLGLIQDSDITESVLEQCMYSWESPPPDLLLRTSGEVRLSDFLLWQSSYSVLSFMPVLWPDFSVWHLYAGVLHYQMNYNAVQDALETHANQAQERQQMEDYENVQEAVKQEGLTHGINMQQRIHDYVEARRKRVQNFLDYVHNKRWDHISKLSAKYQLPPRPTSCV